MVDRLFAAIQGRFHKICGFNGKIDEYQQSIGALCHRIAEMENAMSKLSEHLCPPLVLPLQIVNRCLDKICCALDAANHYVNAYESKFGTLRVFSQRAISAISKSQNLPQEQKEAVELIARCFAKKMLDEFLSHMCNKLEASIGFLLLACSVEMKKTASSSLPEQQSIANQNEERVSGTCCGTPTPEPLVNDTTENPVPIPESFRNAAQKCSMVKLVREALEEEDEVVIFLPDVQIIPDVDIIFKEEWCKTQSFVKMAVIKIEGDLYLFAGGGIGACIYLINDTRQFYQDLKSLVNFRLPDIERFFLMVKMTRIIPDVTRDLDCGWGCFQFICCIPCEDSNPRKIAQAARQFDLSVYRPEPEIMTWCVEKGRGHFEGVCRGALMDSSAKKVSVHVNLDDLAVKINGQERVLW